MKPVPEHPVGLIMFDDVQLQVACLYDNGREWIVDIAAWRRDADDAPETCWGMQPKEARQLAQLLVAAADAAELFSDDQPAPE
jgi:hypothetical protein